MDGVKKISIGPVVFGQPGGLVFIGGLCVIENEKILMRHAEALSELTQSLRLPFIFKASFDKANRSSVKSFRGPGLKEGLRMLAKVKTEFGFPLTTDVHTLEQVGPVSEVADVIQVPAFLCRQTDLIIAAGKTGRAVNVKKGQFLSPWEAKNIVDKLEESGCQKIVLTERGFTFGYQNLVTDFRSIPIMRQFGYPVVFDATHSVQLPGGRGESSGGMSEFIPMLARCAVVAGADGVFMEVHENPEAALSDGPNALPLSKLRPLLEMLKSLKEFSSQKGIPV